MFSLVSNSMNVMGDELLDAFKSYTTRMSHVCIITALAAESRVFIDALKLKPILDHGWRLYGSSEHLLLQTGLGKLKSAAATSAVLHQRADIQSIINVGIAGGLDPIGTELLAHTIIDQGSGFRSYPHLPPQRVVDSMPTTAVETLDSPSSEYRCGVSFDMEAAGIFSAASTYLSSDAMQSIKVISDNPESPLSEFKSANVTELVSQTLPSVMHLLEWYSEQDNLSVESDIQSIAEKLASRWHHSVNDKHQLLRLLHQYYALSDNLPILNEMPELHNAASLRSHLTNKIAQLPLRYGDSL